MREFGDFDDLSSALKVHIAEKLIIESCPIRGLFIGGPDVNWLIYNFAKEFKGGLRGFDGRRVAPLKAALLLIAYWEFTLNKRSEDEDFDVIKVGSGTLASMYLLAQLEFLCRLNSLYLERDGKPKRKIPEQLRRKARLQVNQKRVNGIDQAFVIYLYRNSDALARRLSRLEERLRIAARLRKIRDPVMHGTAEDASIEPYFLALLVAMFYYSSTRN